MSKRPYTVFYGHTHMYKYEQRLGRDYIDLATTGGVFFGGAFSTYEGPSFDHLMLVTVDKEGASIANLRMDGCWIKPATYRIPGML